MIKELIKLANELDNKGLSYEADILDNLAAKIAAADVTEYGVLTGEEPVAQEESGETAAYKIELNALMLDSENWTPEDKALLDSHILNRNIATQRSYQEEE